jgi:uncharacterized protein YjgD (DUF1641 family)
MIYILQKDVIKEIIELKVVKEVARRVSRKKLTNILRLLAELLFDLGKIPDELLKIVFKKKKKFQLWESQIKNLKWNKV